jgi:hypothetical protein
MKPNSVGSKKLPAMTTQTNKPVTRVTVREYGDRHGASGRAYGKPRAIVISILPGDLLCFRLSGCKAREYISIEQVYRYAYQSRVTAEARAKREAKRARTK